MSDRERDRDPDRFQTHCRFCAAVLEAGTVAAVWRKAEEHEKEKHPEAVKPARAVTMEDFGL